MLAHAILLNLAHILGVEIVDGEICSGSFLSDAFWNMIFKGHLFTFAIFRNYFINVLGSKSFAGAIVGRLLILIV
jgi:hypothetical protein